MTYLKLLLLALLFLLIAPSVSAHPGNTDSSGGHTCRTNCDDWGYSYGEYHYHGGYTPTYVPNPPVTPVPSPQPSPSYSPPSQSRQLQSFSSPPKTVETEPYDWSFLWWWLGGGLLGYSIYDSSKKK